MLSTEKLVKKDSDYYLYTPSLMAKELLLYPTIAGHFTWEPGYLIHRTHFNSYLLMLIEEGSCTIRHRGGEQRAVKGQLALIDCYAEHQYGSHEGWTAYWIHFDGREAEAYYRYISEKTGNIIYPADYENVRYLMGHLYRHFKERKPTNEPRLSTFISLILGSMLTSGTQTAAQESSGIQDAIIFINEHFSEPIQLQDMAEVANLSPYYFTRLFTKETGMTPHQYLISTRIASAKYCLTTSQDSVKEIAFKTGFADESSFCSTFKKKEGLTPSTYRNSQRG